MIQYILPALSNDFEVNDMDKPRNDFENEFLEIFDALTPENQFLLAEILKELVHSQEGASDSLNPTLKKA